MIISLKRLAEWARFLTSFIILTLLLYQVISFLSEWVRPIHRYGEPKGRAVKVFAPYGPPLESARDNRIRERILLFYWLGE